MRSLPEPDDPADAPMHPLEARVLAIARRPGHSRVPDKLAHADVLGEGWANREEPTWIDKL